MGREKGQKRRHKEVPILFITVELANIDLEYIYNYISIELCAPETA